MTGTPDHDAIPGWFGKLPSLGDFASRRLPHDFIAVWDWWLQGALDASHAHLGDDWLRCYLTAPIWRFVLLPNLVGDTAWSGVLMPSVDRVGRQFPLTVAACLTSFGAVAYALSHAGEWFEHLEQAALATLDVDSGPDDLDRRLAARRFDPPPVDFAPAPLGQVIRLPSVDVAGSFAHTLALEALATTAKSGGASGAGPGHSPLWRSLWWTRGRIDGGALMLTCGELPTHDEFSRLLVS